MLIRAFGKKSLAEWALRPKFGWRHKVSVLFIFRQSPYEPDK